MLVVPYVLTLFESASNAVSNCSAWVRCWALNCPLRAAHTATQERNPVRTSKRIEILLWGDDLRGSPGHFLANAPCFLEFGTTPGSPDSVYWPSSGNVKRGSN